MPVSLSRAGSGSTVKVERMPLRRGLRADLRGRSERLARPSSPNQTPKRRDVDICTVVGFSWCFCCLLSGAFERQREAVAMVQACFIPSGIRSMFGIQIHVSGHRMYLVSGCAAGKSGCSATGCARPDQCQPTSALQHPWRPFTARLREINNTSLTNSALRGKRRGHADHTMQAAPILLHLCFAILTTSCAAGHPTSSFKPRHSSQNA